jgi:hypothetical protein
MSNYTSWDWNLAEMHLLFFYIWMTGSDHNTNPTIIIQVGIGILSKCIFYFFISGLQGQSHQTTMPIPQLLYHLGLESCRNACFIFYIWMTGSHYNTNLTVIILVGFGILPKCLFYFLCLDHRIRL